GESEIFPAELGIKPGDGLHVTPVVGSTLLHLAIEYDDIDVARWLIERGADVNAKAALDADGFGGHTPLFHTVVTLAAPDDSKARLLLERGANANARATFRKQLRDMGDPPRSRGRLPAAVWERCSRPGQQIVGSEFVRPSAAPAADRVVSPEEGVMRLGPGIALALIAIGGTVPQTPPASPQPDKATGFDPPEVILDGSERLYPAFADIDG